MIAHSSLPKRIKDNDSRGCDCRSASARAAPRCGCCRVQPTHRMERGQKFALRHTVTTGWAHLDPAPRPRGHVAPFNRRGTMRLRNGENSRSVSAGIGFQKDGLRFIVPVTSGTTCCTVQGYRPAHSLRTASIYGHQNPGRSEALARPTKTRWHRGYGRI